MQIVFSDHAISRIKERRISSLKIYATVKSPQEILSSFKERHIYRRRYGTKTLEVVTKTEGKIIVIISAYMIK